MADEQTLRQAVGLLVTEIVRERQAKVDRALADYRSRSAAFDATFRATDAGRKAASGSLPEERERLERIAESIRHGVEDGCTALWRGEDGQDAFKAMHDGFAQAASVWQRMIDRTEFR